MKTCYLIGGGTSLKSHIESGLWDIIKDKDVWSLNFAFKFMPFLPTKQLWVDTMFFKNNIHELQNLYEQGKTEFYCKANELYKAYPFINQRYTQREIDKVDKIHLYIGKLGLVGLFAISEAIHEDYDTIYLFGYDFGTRNPTDTNTHFYQEQTREKRIISSGVGNTNVYFRNQQLKDGVKDFDFYKKFNKQIYNVSGISNISSFPILSYQEFVERHNNAN